MRLREVLIEKAPIEVPKIANMLFSLLEANLPVRDGKRRGEKYDETGYYAVRILPKEKEDGSNLLEQTEKFVKSSAGKKQGLKFEKTVAMMHSGKFSSVLVKFMGFDFGIVVGAGANKGESFEKELLIKMDNAIAGVDTSDEAEEALAAIMKADPKIKRSNIESVVPRTGKTQRSAGMSPDEAGKIIADIIIKMKRGSDVYVSLKNVLGSNVAQFGCADVFNDDLTINTTSAKWKHWMSPLGLDPKKIKAGLESYMSGKAPSFATEESVGKKIKPGSPTYKMLESMWGTGYVYLREKKGGFEAFVVNSDYLESHLLHNLTITKILYPSPDRKAIEVHLTTSTGGYKVRMRNKNDPKSVRPTIIQLEKTK